jgi:hypothetical protein
MVVLYVVHWKLTALLLLKLLLFFVLDYCWAIVAAETLATAYAIKNLNRDLNDLSF